MYSLNFDIEITDKVSDVYDKRVNITSEMERHHNSMVSINVLSENS